MSIAVCFSCGAMKFGALTPCDNCKVRPTAEDDIILSMLLTDRHLPIPELESLSHSIMRGEGRPNVDERTKELYRPSARKAQMMLGMVPQHSAGNAFDIPKGYEMSVPKGFWKKMKHYWLHGWR